VAHYGPTLEAESKICWRQRSVRKSVGSHWWKYVPTEGDWRL